MKTVYMSNTPTPLPQTTPLPLPPQAGRTQKTGSVFSSS